VGRLPAVTGAPKNRVSPATFRDWRRRSLTFEAIAAYGGRDIDLAGGGPPEHFLGAAATANLIPMLGVRPLLGRTFTADEERLETRAIVLSYRLWQRRFDGDPNLVGNPVTMNGLAYTVIGVMPKGFQFPDRQTELWQPLGLSPQLLARRNSHLPEGGRTPQARSHRPPGAVRYERRRRAAG
jgi:putative ABC transport system permease protein